MSAPNLQLPLLAAGQAQKHVTMNEALFAIDDLIHIRVAGFRVNAPPASPADCARYIVGPLPVAAWAGHAGHLAVWRDGLWNFHAPRAGWTVLVAGEEQARIHDGADWQMVRRLGINATADEANPFAVAGPASLFNHAGQGHQIKLNKASAADTASLIFQTGFSGRAEIGRAGSDGLAFKVSADGAVWTTALSIDPASGIVSLPGQKQVAARQNLLVNGDFQINQREFADGSLDPAAFGFDRWRAGAGGASLQRSGRVVTLASGVIEQPVEADLWGIDTFNSRTVTVSVENPSASLAVDMAGASGTITAASGRRVAGSAPLGRGSCI